MWYCYIIRNTKQEFKNLTYNGSTNNPIKRLRQHNKEISGGARYTSRTNGGWEYYFLMSGFPDHINTLQCEWRIKHCTGKPGPRPRQYCGVEGRIKGIMNEVLHLEYWTGKSVINNRTSAFNVYITEDCLRNIELSNIPSYINLIKVITITPDMYGNYPLINVSTCENI
jgi:predicted GIY-YIG superfamily endonuclease